MLKYVLYKNNIIPLGKEQILKIPAISPKTLTY